MIQIDMNMPENCMVCRFCFDEEGISLQCTLTDMFVGMNYINRHPSCPLIEIKEE